MFFKFSAALIAAAMVQVTGAAQFNVTVGGPGTLTFSPESINASVGDTILFTFMQKNHTVTQSTLANPCQPLAGGFDSGFVPVADTNTAGPFPAAELVIEDTNPVWVYCRQANHCQQGMVFAVNPGADFSTFKASAMGATGTSPASVVTVTQTVTIPGSTTYTTTYQSTPGSSPTPTSTPAMSTDHKVIVGGSSLIFSPSNITAQIGDTITFQFMQKNHTVTQSSFATPCQPLSGASTGFDSGFFPVAANATTFPTYTIQVNSTTPIWAYCKQANHCTSGMVFAVNAVESGPNNFEAFLAKAKGLAVGGSSSGSASSPSPTSGTAGNINGVGRVDVGSGLGMLGVLITSFWVMM